MMPAGEPPSASGLARALGPGAVLFLTLSATTPASSLFVIVPGMLRVAGTGALAAMLAAALVCVATAFLYAELSAAWPVAGGEYVVVARTLGPLAGFVVLGVNVVNNLIFLPVVALGLADVLRGLSPGLPTVPVAIATVAAATGLGLLDVRLNAVVTGLFLLVEAAVLVGVAALGLTHPLRGLGVLLHPVVPSGTGLAPAGAAAIGIATTIAVFALNGYGMAAYFGEDLREAPRRIARIVLWAVATTILAELVPLAAAIAGTPDLADLLRADDPFGRFVAARAGERAAGWAAAGVALAIVNAAIVSVLAFARFLFATARDRVWGGGLDRGLAAIHPRLGSPWAATLAVGGIGAAACLAPLDLLLVMSGAGLVLTYAALGLATIAGRRRGTTAHAPYRMPWYPLWPLLTLAALGGIAWSNWLDEGAGRPALLATLAQVVVAALYYALVLRRRGPWVVRDP